MYSQQQRNQYTVALVFAIIFLCFSIGMAVLISTSQAKQWVMVFPLLIGFTPLILLIARYFNQRREEQLLINQQNIYTYHQNPQGQFIQPQQPPGQFIQQPQYPLQPQQQAPYYQPPYSGQAPYPQNHSDQNQVTQPANYAAPYQQQQFPVQQGDAFQAYQQQQPVLAKF